MLWLHYRVYNNNVEGEMKMEIAEKTRTLEFIGLSISLVALLASLVIFCRFRSLRNTRTRIHKNLFVAMVVQVLIRLTLYIDIAIYRRKPHGMQRGIGNTPVLCEASYVLLEYVKTAMFMWMFIEGLFLHNLVTVTVFQETSYYRMYRFVGWGCPLLMTLAWAIIMAFYYHPKSKFLRCWSGYNLSSYFWILEGPRFAVILLNFLFLLNIIRVLVVKLRQSHTSEIEQVLKAVRAAVVLLPLLGITNVLFMIKVPLDNVNKFAVWSYSTHFLRSFQGLFIATLYCFLNGEVRLALDKTVAIHLSLRGSDLQTRRRLTLNGCPPQQITSVNEIEKKKTRLTGWMRLCCRGGNIPPPDRPIRIEEQRDEKIECIFSQGRQSNPSKRMNFSTSGKQSCSKIIPSIVELPMLHSDISDFPLTQVGTARITSQ
ncbi:PDF receptor isoform X3 [Solenopsis invicta]|nr:PDF receptor isoform X3 [Solenopsis invicta]XP_039302430.1 PDF receptor isoform X3 [Solenopsis invicta]